MTSIIIHSGRFPLELNAVTIFKRLAILRRCASELVSRMRSRSSTSMAGMSIWARASRMTSPPMPTSKAPYPKVSMPSR